MPDRLYNTLMDCRRHHTPYDVFTCCVGLRKASTQPTMFLRLEHEVV